MGTFSSRQKCVICILLQAISYNLLVWLEICLDKHCIKFHNFCFPRIYFLTVFVPCTFHVTQDRCHCNPSWALCRYKIVCWHFFPCFNIPLKVKHLKPDRFENQYVFSYWNNMLTWKALKIMLLSLWGGSLQRSFKHLVSWYPLAWTSLFGNNTLSCVFPYMLGSQTSFPNCQHLSGRKCCSSSAHQQMNCWELLKLLRVRRFWREPKDWLLGHVF